VSEPQRTYKTRAFVLRARNLGEADKIFTLFTQARGKIAAVAKGVRRVKSHFTGRLEFMSEAQLSMHRGRNLDVITGADIVTQHWSRLTDPAAFATAHVVAELVDAFCELDLPIPEIYGLLQGAVGAVAATEDPAGLLPRFELRLLAALGYAPEADVCVRCGAPLDGAAAWADLDAGGLACASCRPHRADALGLGVEDVSNFRALGAARGGSQRAAAEATGPAARAADAFLTYHLGKRPNASKLLADLAAVRA
jgi:DNA repair protein RecO (recombination protein O)